MNGNQAISTNPDDERKRLYKLLRVGKSELGLNEDEYRSVLYANGAKLVDDKWSAATMSITQLNHALAQLRRYGFQPKHRHQGQQKGKPKGDWRDPRINKAYAIWCALADAGVVRNRSWSALHKWAYRITRKAKLDWAGPDDLNDVIEGLKSWAMRERVKLEQ